MGTSFDLRTPRDRKHYPFPGLFFNKHLNLYFGLPFELAQFQLLAILFSLSPLNSALADSIFLF